MNTEQVLKNLIEKNPGEVEYHQAVREVLESIEEVYNKNPRYEAANIIDRITEPDRILMFRVPWQDDRGKINVNRGYRIEFNSALGPYKGGLRFHPEVSLGTFKFLGFEQIFKNALTTLPMGGGKGGSDFDPKGKSDNEVMRFCQSFMTELYRHIGPNTDVPAGDIGVGGREIGFLFGQYRRLVNRFEGVLTGKGTHWGGSWIRKEATGYGLVYITEKFLEEHGTTMKDKIVTISGAGNVAIYAAEKVQQLGGKVVTMSDSNGCIIDMDGIDLDLVKEIKEVRRGRILEYCETRTKAQYSEDRNDVWKVNTDVALPCATQNELDLESARILVKNNCSIIAEGANMPTTLEATKYFLEQKVGFIPGKAANAGGVAVSGLEMSQNAMKLMWMPEEVDNRLKQIMLNIHNACVQYGKQSDGYIDYVKGANVAGFFKVANAMLDHGLV
ncbi:NADP-specific glutamate dehydrogenase [Saccharicrinis sp. FJH62]|uniref:NADP-specific glutamate dehydrogenase n=1 Tax=Saccharicrinis sp. FJH62 TaxID=3344657 RepID=UPI0035D4FA0D